MLVIKDSSSGAERRVTLSSIRAPRPARRDEKPEPYGTEAKEFLRQRLIGAGLRQSVPRRMSLLLSDRSRLLVRARL